MKKAWAASDGLLNEMNKNREGGGTAGTERDLFRNLSEWGHDRAGGDGENKAGKDDGVARTLSDLF